MNSKRPKHIITIRKPDLESLALFLWLCMDLILATSRFVLTKIGLGGGLLRESLLYLITCIPLLILIYGFFVNNKRKLSKSSIAFIKLYGLFILALGITLFFFPQRSEFLFRSSYGILPMFRPTGAILAFLFFAEFSDPKKLQSVLIKAAYVIFFYLIVVLYIPAVRRGYWIDIAPDGGMTNSRYSLSFGYDLMVPMAIFFTTAMKSHKFIHYMIVVACVALILTNGSRGAVVVLFIFAALLTINYIKGRKTSALKKTVFIIGMMFSFAIIVFFRGSLLQWLTNYLSNHSISSRTLEMITGGSFSDSNGRELIWETVLQAIKDGGLFGYGLFGDRPFVVNIHYAGYSHNVLLELLVSFGIIGVFLIIWIIVDAVKMILLCKDDDWRLLYFVFFSCSCKLLLSLSLWYVWEFWAAAAIAYNYRRLDRINPQYTVLKTNS